MLVQSGMVVIRDVKIASLGTVFPLNGHVSLCLLHTADGVQSRCEVPVLAVVWVSSESQRVF